MSFQSALQILLCIASLISSSSAQERKVPTAKDIDDYDDPVLKEIFHGKSSAGASPEQNGFQSPGQAPLATQRPGAADRWNSVPIPRSPSMPNSYYSTGQQVQQPPPALAPAPPSNYYYPQNPAGQQFASYAVQGAQTLYTGAQQVGQVLGIPSYENSFVSSAVSFLG